MKGKVADTITVRYGSWTTTISRKEHRSGAPDQADITSSHRQSDPPPAN